MNTKKFRTKTEFIERDNGKIEGKWEIAIDIGYSAVKLFSPNAIACFPSYAKRVDADFQFAGVTPANSILFKDCTTGQRWIVGEVAQNMIKSGDTSDSETALYGRERYTDEMFLVVMRVGLGLGMIGNQHGAYKGEDIIIQTGLPEKYMRDDKNIREALGGTHDFEIKVGGGKWYKFNFTIPQENIFVMSQPKGTLFSLCIDDDGHTNKGLLSSSVIVFDPGFGTLDIFPITSGAVGKGETFVDLGMKRVLQETSKLIQETYDIDIPVPAMQKYLETGNVRYVDKKTLKGKEYPFEQLLGKANRMVCDEAVNRMINTINLIDFDYMIITGGTGAAWCHYIKEKFKNLDTLKLLYGNQNSNLSFIYSNVRGYYLYRFGKLAAQAQEIKKVEG